MSIDRSSLCMALVAIACLAGSSSAQAATGEPDGRAEATLKMEPRKLDFENNKKLGMMYMPCGTALDAQKPEWVTKEPKYAATPKYAVLKIGNTENNRYAIALDEPAGGEARIYADLNGNGDLTDDGDGRWEVRNEKPGSSAEYNGTIVFKAHWKNSDGVVSHDDFGVNFYRSPDRESLNYYRASARTGKIDVDGKSYEVTLFESDCDGIYNKLYDPKKPVAPEKLPKPVFLLLDGGQYDIRGTFGFNGYNYVARVSDDGAKLVLEPTVRQITLPRPTERPQMLGAGGPLPEFEAQWWSEDSSAKPVTFKSSDFKGKKIVVLDMWATWCGPCMRGIPHLSKIAEEVKGQDVEVIALNVWDDAKAFEKFAAEKGKSYAFRLARDPSGREPRDATIPARLFRLSGIPATYVIGKDGKIEASISGYTEGDKQVEHALVRLGVKIEGVTAEEAAAAKPAKTPKPTGMVPATKMN